MTEVAKKKTGYQNDSDEAKPDRAVLSDEFIINSLKWIELLLKDAKKLSKKDNFGIFGTSIAATWLFSEIGKSIKFFVDEDRHRAGGTYMGVPVYHPDEIPANGHVFLALSFIYSGSIESRHFHASIHPDRQ